MTNEPAEEQYEEEQQPRRSFWQLVALWSMPAWLVSLIFHFCGLTALVLATLAPPQPPKTLSLTATEEVSEDLEEMVEFQPEIEEQMDLEMAPPQMMSQTFEALAMAPDPSMLSESVSISEMVPSEPVDFSGMSPEGLMTEIDGMGNTTGKMAKFFGTNAKGQRICFLVDNSNSMGAGRMETALVELEKAVSKLAPQQKFYIAFYSDTAYPLFYPTAANGMVNATPENKAKVREWLKTIQMCLRTDGRDAVTLALKLKPDLIYILGDGAFTDRSDIELANTPLSGITIHTLGMQVQPKDRDRFAAIAKTHGGTYKDVGVTEQGKKMLQMNGPIARNNRRKGIWGIKLK